MRDPITLNQQNAVYGTSYATDDARKVLRNTYLLLSMTIAVSAAACWTGVAFAFPSWIGLPLALVGLGLIFAIRKTAHSITGLYLTFAFTAVMGASMSPLITHYLKMPSGGALIAQALGLTSIVFVTLSGVALTSKRDFSFMQNFLLVGLLVVVFGGLLNIFLQIPMLHLALLCMCVLVMSGLILFDTQRIIRGGETNYILATVSLYLNIHNLFTSILQLFGILGSDD
jgi:modulator of FtsH protease